VNFFTYEQKNLSFYKMGWTQVKTAVWVYIEDFNIKTLYSKSTLKLKCWCEKIQQTNKILSYFAFKHMGVFKKLNPTLQLCSWPFSPFKFIINIQSFPQKLGYLNPPPNSRWCTYDVFPGPRFKFTPTYENSSRFNPAG